MSRLGRSELVLGEFLDLDETLHRLRQVTREGVRELAAELVERPLSVARRRLPSRKSALSGLGGVPASAA